MHKRINPIEIKMRKPLIMDHETRVEGFNWKLDKLKDKYAICKIKELKCKRYSQENAGKCMYETALDAIYASIISHIAHFCVASHTKINRQ
jgi:hypothetical protein